MGCRLRPRGTFPSSLPLLRLDRVYADSLGVTAVRTERTPLARAASDHLPVLVELEVPPPSVSGEVESTVTQPAL